MLQRVKNRKEKKSEVNKLDPRMCIDSYLERKKRSIYTIRDLFSFVCTKRRKGIAISDDLRHTHWKFSIFFFLFFKACLFVNFLSYFFLSKYKLSKLQHMKWFIFIFSKEAEHWRDAYKNFRLLVENHFDGVDKSDKFVDQTQILLEREIKNWVTEHTETKRVEWGGENHIHHSYIAPSPPKNANTHTITLTLIHNSVWAIISKLSMMSDCRKVYILFIICCIFIVVNVHTTLEYQRDDIWIAASVAAVADIRRLYIHCSVIYQYYRHCV